LYQEPQSSTEKSKLLAYTKNPRYPEEAHHLVSDGTEAEKNLINNTKRKGAKISKNSKNSTLVHNWTILNFLQ
jgi:hypothetical protein